MLTLGNKSFRINEEQSGMFLSIGKNYPGTNETSSDLCWWIEATTVAQEVRLPDQDRAMQSHEYYPRCIVYLNAPRMRSWTAIQGLSGIIPETRSSLYVESHEAIKCGGFALNDRRGTSFRFLASGTADIWTDLDASEFGWGEATPLAIDTRVTFRAVLVHLNDTGIDPIQRSMEVLRGVLCDSDFRPDSHFEMRRSGGQVFGHQVRLTPIVEPLRPANGG